MAESATTIQIEFIKKCLRKGDKRKAILAKYVKKWQNTSDRTFDRRLRLAEEAMAIENKSIQDKVEEEVAKEVEARKLDIMDAMERKATLTQIARGEIPLRKAIVVDKFIEYIEVIPDWMDRKNAIAELNKMEGDYAPAKFSPTNPDGTPLEPKKVIMTAEQLAELKQSIESKK